MSPVQAPPAAVTFFLLATALLWGGLLWGGVPWLGGGRVQDWPLRLFLATTGTVIVVGWVATTLALVGLYSLASLAVVLLGCAGLLGWAARGHPPAGRCSRGGWHEVALAALMGLGAFFYLRPTNICWAEAMRAATSTLPQQLRAPAPISNATSGIVFWPAMLR